MNDRRGSAKLRQAPPSSAKLHQAPPSSTKLRQGPSAAPPAGPGPMGESRSAAAAGAGGKQDYGEELAP
jgi:hypothetical protein